MSLTFMLGELLEQIMLVNKEHVYERLDGHAMINKVQHSFAANKMEFNRDKCQVLLLCRKNETIL